MVTSIARQSVIIKCNMQASIMLGNYEFYYGAGLFCKIRGITVKEDIQPLDLQEVLMAELKKFAGEDAKEKYLVKILMNCNVSEDYDEQMKELLLCGIHEEHMWQVNI